ncbi:hypothetical protein [Sinomonas mesophila]|uniref:hypothetical protein n=1 Tax=Sinomonas mesophila TaxID=1531955 RepID=UPI00111564B7|nr:hypothetical protein [Sinomonas mesophila]
MTEVHFSYPEDGNFHYTYKFGAEGTVRGYWNETVIHSYGPEGDRTLVPRTDDNWMLFNHMAPVYKAPALRDYAEGPEFFPFPGGSFNTDPEVPYYTRENASSSRPNSRRDIEVEAGSGMVSINAFFVGKGHAFNSGPTST